MVNILTASTWSEFRALYFAHAVPGMAESTGGLISSIFRMFERLGRPGKLSEISSIHIDQFIAGRRRQGVRDTTIRGDLMHLRSAFNWMKRRKLIAEVPAIDLPKRAKAQKAMKGRPITQEEFDSILAQTDDISWQWLLKGLWWSGLRLGEALALRWKPGMGGMHIDFSHGQPMFRIPASAQKNHEEDILPMAPEFQDMLLIAPEQYRVGKVFHPPFHSLESVSQFISELGKKAGVVVDQSRGQIKYASAHDFRRSFGNRWAMNPRITPQILMRLMRHERIETTMRYYVGKNALLVSDICREVFEAARSPSIISSS